MILISLWPSLRTKNLILDDDPNFIPSMELPQLVIDGELIIRRVHSQIDDLINSKKLSSQLSPLGSGKPSPNSRQRAINLPETGSGAESSLRGQLAVPDPFGKSPMDRMDFDNMLEIDADGNVRNMLDEDDVSAFTAAAARSSSIMPNLALPDISLAAPHLEAGVPPPSQAESRALEMDVDAGVAEVEPLPVDTGRPKNNRDSVLEQELQGRSQHLGAVTLQQSRRERHTKGPIMVDVGRLNLTTREYMAQGANYVEKQEAASMARRSRAAAQRTRLSEQDACYPVYWPGVQDCGLPTGVPGMLQPLAQFFAGDALRRMIRGKVDGSAAGGLRRTLGSAFGDDEEGHGRKRPRVEEESGEYGRHVDQGASALLGGDDGMMVVADDNHLEEVARDGRGQQTGEDLHSSIMPWTGPHSSQSKLEGSTVGSKGKGVRVGSAMRGGSSPLAGHGRSSGLPGGDIERLLGGSVNSPSMLRFSSAAAGASPRVAGGGDASSLLQKSGASASGSYTSDVTRFLYVLRSVADVAGTSRDNVDDDQKRRNWISFDAFLNRDDTFLQGDQKAVATQAFVKVLELATRGVVRVDQPGRSNETPFVPIWIGVDDGNGDGNEDNSGSVAEAPVATMKSDSQSSRWMG